MSRHENGEEGLPWMRTSSLCANAFPLTRSTFLREGISGHHPKQMVATLKNDVMWVLKRVTLTDSGDGIKLR